MAIHMGINTMNANIITNSDQTLHGQETTDTEQEYKHGQAPHTSETGTINQRHRHSQMHDFVAEIVDIFGDKTAAEDNVYRQINKLQMMDDYARIDQIVGYDERIMEDMAHMMPRHKLAEYITQEGRIWSSAHADNVLRLVQTKPWVYNMVTEMLVAGETLGSASHGDPAWVQVLTAFAKECRTLMGSSGVSNQTTGVQLRFMLTDRTLAPYHGVFARYAARQIVWTHDTNALAFAQKHNVLQHVCVLIPLYARLAIKLTTHSPRKQRDTDAHANPNAGSTDDATSQHVLSKCVHCLMANKSRQFACFAFFVLCLHYVRRFRSHHRSHHREQHREQHHKQHHEQHEEQHREQDQHSDEETVSMSVFFKQLANICALFRKQKHENSISVAFLNAHSVKEAPRRPQ